MIGISGSDASQNTTGRLEALTKDPQARIRFENTLAAHAAAGKQPKDAVQSVLDMNSLSDVVSPLSGRPLVGVRRPIPSQKVLQSLNHLVEQGHAGKGSGIDIHT